MTNRKFLYETQCCNISNIFPHNFFSIDIITEIDISNPKTNKKCIAFNQNPSG